MSDTLFPPGPYTVGYRAMHVDATNPYGKGVMKLCDIRGRGHLTGMGHGACGMDADKAEVIQESVANLFAASIDLYEAHTAQIALEDHVYRCPYCTDGGPSYSCPTCEQLQNAATMKRNAAIAKARGESPTPNTESEARR